MPEPLITLTTDFGEGSPFVAAMKGVILGINPQARLLDLSHQVPPHDLRWASFFLESVIPCFPPGVIHVVVVDPGVGTGRALLHVEIQGQRLLVPDNGCWTGLERPGQAVQVRRLENSTYWRHPVSSTFHGRDILGPVAGHLSLGLDPALLGPAVTDWVRLRHPQAHLDPASGEVVGEVMFVDRFGNLMTNLPASMFGGKPPAQVRIGGQPVPTWVHTYGEAPAGTLVALYSSTGNLEVAIAQGDAARKLAIHVGAPVRACPDKGESIQRIP